MQVIPPEYPAPLRLTCGCCLHWQESAFHTLADAESAGRCARFGEIRPALSRPRCNICWEPSVATRSVAKAETT